MRDSLLIFLVALGCSLVMSRSFEDIGANDQYGGVRRPSINSGLVGALLDGAKKAVEGITNAVVDVSSGSVIGGLKDDGIGALNDIGDTVSAISPGAVKNVFYALRGGVGCAYVQIENRVSNLKPRTVNTGIDTLHDKASGVCEALENTVSVLSSGVVKSAIEAGYDFAAGALEAIESS